MEKCTTLTIISQILVELLQPGVGTITVCDKRNEKHQFTSEITDIFFVALPTQSMTTSPSETANGIKKRNAQTERRQETPDWKNLERDRKPRKKLNGQRRSPGIALQARLENGTRTHSQLTFG
jgi:hypothetical protein